MKVIREIKELYSGKKAEAWEREKPENIGDLIAKEYLLDRLQKAVKGKVVLDAGCGEGYISRKIAGKAKKVIGVDISEELIKLARENPNNKSNISFMIGDLKKLSRFVLERVDIIVISFVLHYFKSYQLKNVFKELHNTLKPKGEIFIVGPNPYSLIRHKSSPWMEHKHFSNVSKNDFLKIKTKKLSGGKREVGFYFYGFEDYFTAILENNLKILEFKDLNPSKELIKKYPSLKREKYLFFFMHLKKS